MARRAMPRPAAAPPCRNTRRGQPFPDAVAHALVVAFIVLLGWSAVTAVTLATDFHLRRTNIGFQSDPLARKRLTQVRVLRRVTTTLVAIMTIAAALMTFESVKLYGVSLIASAGAAPVRPPRDADARADAQLIQIAGIVNGPLTRLSLNRPATYLRPCQLSDIA